MRKVAIAALCALTLIGCASTGPYGNYLGETTNINQHQLADEAVKQLVTLYPPAKVRLDMQQPTPDAFGVALVNGLRESGYAVLELDPKAAKAAATADGPPVPPVPGAAQALPLSYVVDQAGSSTLYRLTVVVGSQSITRPYRYQNGALAAAGYWVRKE